MPTITIVMPTYNVAPYLSFTLESVQKQSFQDWECILVDDGSQDDTVKVAKKYVESDNRFRLLEQENAGPSVARNYGYSQSDPASRYITFMDSDDIWIPEALQLLHDELAKFPHAAGAHGLADFIDAQGKPLHPGKFAASGLKRREVRGRQWIWLKPDEPTTFAGLSTDNVLFPPGLWLARREAYAKTPGFDPKQKAAEDWDVLIDVSRHGEFRFINKVILFYRRHDNNLGATSVTPLMAYRTRCKAFYSPLNTPVQRQLVRNGWRAYQVECIQERASLARQMLRGGNYKAAVLSSIHIPIHLWRFLRGKPSLRSLSPELRQFPQA